MSSVRVREFVPSYKARGRSPEFGTFGDFMVSPQIVKPLLLASADIIRLVRGAVPPSADKVKGVHYRDAFRVTVGKLRMVVYGGYPSTRSIVKIHNDASHAAALEFGSGPPAEGESAGEERPQGGWNQPMRPLYTNARKLGRPFRIGEQ